MHALLEKRDLKQFDAKPDMPRETGKQGSWKPETELRDTIFHFLLQPAKDAVRCFKILLPGKMGELTFTMAEKGISDTVPNR